MSVGAFIPAPSLPPPAATILLYAADGLSVWKKHLGPNGFPRMPERTIWVPLFRELVNSGEGMRTLHALARAGMQAWRCPLDQLNCLKSAFQDITMRALLIATLEDYADTSYFRVILPPAPSRPQPLAAPSRPEPPQRDSFVKPNSPPRRSWGRPQGSTPQPG